MTSVIESVFGTVARFIHELASDHEQLDPRIVRVEQVREAVAQAARALAVERARRSNK